MNDAIRAAVVARLEEQGLSRADLARAVGKHPNAITRALNGLPDGGRIPELWAAILEATDLHLEALPGREVIQKPAPKGKPGRKPSKTTSEDLQSSSKAKP